MALLVWDGAEPGGGKRQWQGREGNVGGEEWRVVLVVREGGQC